MSFFEFPYTRTYSSDLGWLIRHVKWLTDEVENKTIKYADPIEWNITSQYEKNTVVLDGTVAYLSKDAVPSGVSISNPNYWQPIFDIAPIIGDIDNLRDQISEHYEDTYTASRNYAAGDWMFINDNDESLLYYALTAITVNGGLVPDVTIKKATVEDIVLSCFAEIARVDGDLVALDGRVGDLDDLTTTDKTSIVNAINEVDGDVGDLADLTTTDKSSIVNAINEVDDHADTNAADLIALSNRVGELVDLTTTDKTSIVNAINSVESQITALKSTVYINVKDYGAVGDGVTDDTAAINAAKAVAETYTNGACLFFPAGKYLISSTLTFNYIPGHGLGGVSILGEGNYSSIIMTNTDIDLIKYEGDDTVPDYDGYLYGILISDIYLFKPGDSASAHNGLSFINCGLVYCANVRIRYFKYGVYLSGCSNSTFLKVDISANVANSHGFDVGDRSVSNAYIACSFSASGDAASLFADSYGFNAERGNISDQNIIYFDVGGNATVAVRFNGVNTLTNQTGDINIIDLVCETYYGVQVYNFARHGNFNIIGGWFNCNATNPRSGVFLTNCNGVSVNGATFVNNIGSGDTLNKVAVKLSGSDNGSIKVVNCLIKNQDAFDGSAGGGAVMFNNNFIHYEGGVSSQNTCVGINAKNSIAIGNVFRGGCLRYIRMMSGATYSLCANNVGAGGASSTAFQNDAGGTTVLANNVNG